MEKNKIEWGGSIYQQTRQPVLRDFSHILQLTDTKELLLYIENSLRQYKWNSATKSWEKVVGLEPMMTEEGIQRILAIPQVICNKVIGQGNLQSHDIDKLSMYYKALKTLMEWVNDEIFINGERYKIRVEDEAYIKRLVIEPVKIFITKLIDDKERQYIYGDNRMEKIERFAMPKEVKSAPIGV